MDEPAVRLESFADVLGKGERGGAIDGDVIVVVEDLELAELQVPGERAGLRSDALFHVAVAGEHPDAVVEERKTFAVEAVATQALGDRHADRVREPLAQ